MDRRLFLSFVIAAALFSLPDAAAESPCPVFDFNDLPALCLGMEPLFGVNGTEDSDCIIGTGGVRGEWLMGHSLQCRGFLSKPGELNFPFAFARVSGRYPLWLRRR